MDTFTDVSSSPLLSIIDILDNKIIPLQERFYNFLIKHEAYMSDIDDVPTFNIASVNDKGKKRLPPLEEYKLTTLRLVKEEPDYVKKIVLKKIPDGSEGFHYSVMDNQEKSKGNEHYFTIPFMYIERPDAWEEEILKQIKNKKALAKKVLKEVFPEKKGLFYFCHYANSDNIYDDTVNRTRFLYITLNESKLSKKEIKKFRKAYAYAEGTNLVLDISTGLIYREGIAIETRLNHGESEFSFEPPLECLGGIAV